MNLSPALPTAAIWGSSGLAAPKHTPPLSGLHGCYQPVQKSPQAGGPQGCGPVERGPSPGCGIPSLLELFTLEMSAVPRVHQEFLLLSPFPSWDSAATGSRQCVGRAPCTRTETCRRG